MSTFDRREPPRSFTTDGGVTVIVQPPPPPETQRASDLCANQPPVVVVPPPRPEHERNAFVRALLAQHEGFIRRMLLRRGDVLEESAKDLAQRVALIAADYVQKNNREPENMRGFLTGVIRNEVRHHKRRWRPQVDPEADTDAAIGSTPSPESLARQAEDREALERYLARLAPEEAEVVRAIDMQGLTVDAAAALLKRPRGTVSTQRIRGLGKLMEMAARDEEEAKRAK
ncbi:MAG: sigma-70 family RNA polymerase sigma factor [Minicystis sp.]